MSSECWWLHGHLSAKWEMVTCSMTYHKQPSCLPRSHRLLQKQHPSVILLHSIKSLHLNPVLMISKLPLSCTVFNIQVFRQVRRSTEADESPTLHHYIWALDWPTGAIHLLNNEAPSASLKKISPTLMPSTLEGQWNLFSAFTYEKFSPQETCSCLL